MKISEITPGAMKITVDGKIIEKSQPREVNTRFGQNFVCEAVLEDETGTITLVLWGDQISLVNEGDHIRIENGYVKEWNGVLQLQVGKYGKITAG